MQSVNNARSSLFLIELIIAIMFFSLGAAVCAQVFAKAHTVTAEARDLAFASSAVSGAANAVKYTDGSLDALSAYLPGVHADGEDIAVCYDGAFDPCEPANAAYTLFIHTAAGGGVETARVWMDGADGGTLYELDLRWPASEKREP